MPFNRVVVANGSMSELLNIEEGTELSFTEMQARLYDRIYRLGLVYTEEGDRAHRRRARDRRAEKARKKKAREQRATTQRELRAAARRDRRRAARLRSVSR